MFVMLDVAIGLIFTYLLLSLLCTAINEWVSSLWRIRGHYLKKAIGRLVTPDGKGAPASADVILNQPEIQALSPKADRPPSYIPKEMFVRAATSAKVAPSRTPEEWGFLFDASMDRASGWFKRRIQVVSVFVALGLTLVANADTLQIVNGLWQSPTLRAQFLEAARDRTSDRATEDVVDHYRDPDIPMLSEEEGGSLESEEDVGEGAALPSAQEQELLAGVMGWRMDFAKFNQVICDDYEAEREAVCSAPNSSEKCTALLDRISKDPRVRLEGASLVPTNGWPEAGTFFRKKNLLLPFVHLPGWLFTIAAISLGAPFWFDLLSRFVNIRGAGKPPEENKQITPPAPQVLLVAPALATTPSPATAPPPGTPPPPPPAPTGGVR